MTPALCAKADPKKATQADNMEGRIVAVEEPAPGGRPQTEREGERAKSEKERR